MRATLAILRSEVFFGLCAPVSVGTVPASPGVTSSTPYHGPLRAHAMGHAVQNVHHEHIVSKL